jgi:hypothetical protein
LKCHRKECAFSKQRFLSQQIGRERVLDPLPYSGVSDQLSFAYGDFRIAALVCNQGPLKLLHRPASESPAVNRPVT